MMVVAALMLMFVTIVMAAISVSTNVIHGIFVSSATAAGTMLISINWLYVIGYILLTVVIPFIVEYIKKKFPQILTKAWLPIVIGALISAGTGLIAGQITGWASLATYLFAGISSGGIASSGRDLIVGK